MEVRIRGVGTGGAGQGGHGPPMLEEAGGGARVSFGPPQNLGGLGFESAIPGGKKHNIDHIL